MEASFGLFKFHPRWLMGLGIAAFYNMQLKTRCMKKYCSNGYGVIGKRVPMPSIYKTI